MNINRSIRNANEKTKDDEELELDESLLLEEKLKNLLTANKRKLKRPRDVFNNIQDDVPKLRRSVVDRALQTCISSTPMPTAAKRVFFGPENSLNISPICSNSEKVDNEPQEYNKEQTNKKNNEEKNEPHVFLIKSPIFIPDSSDEHIAHTDDIKNKPGSKNVNTENNDKQTKFPYNTRSLDKIKITKRVTQERASPTNKVSQILDTTLKEVEPSRNLKKKDIVASVKVNKKLNRKDTLSNRKRIDGNVLPKKQISPNRSNQSGNGVKKQSELVSKQIESSIHSRGRKKADASKKKTLKSSISKNSIKEISEIENAQISSNEINKNNTFNDGIDNINGTCSQRLLRVARKNCERTLNEINCHNIINESPQRISPRNLTPKNVAVTKNKVENQRGMSPRKLSFLHKDPEETNGIDVLDINSKQSKKTVDGIKQPVENPSKIHVLSSRSKSKELSLDRIIKTLRNRSISVELDTDNNNSSKRSVKPIEKTIRPLESPPKRPQRLKKSKRGKNLLEQESLKKNKSVSIITHQNHQILAEPPEIINRSTITIENDDKSLKQTENDSEKSCSPNKLKTLYENISDNTSSDNSKKSHRQFEVLSNILISMKNGEEVTKGKTQEDTDNLLEKVNIPAKTYIEIGTSPLILENEIKTMNSENNLMATNNSEETFKSNNKIVAECKEDPNPENTLVEIDSSPIKFTGTDIDIYRRVTPKKALAEPDTSPLNFENTVHTGSKTDVRCNKTENQLNQLLSKLTNNCSTSPDIPNTQINSNTRTLVNPNQSLHKEIETSTKASLEYSSPSKRIHKEIQTSIKSARKRTPYEKNFPKNIFTQTALEQGTQTSTSLTRTSESCSKNEKMEEEVDNKSDCSGTDQSEILKEFERERDRTASNMLFETLSNLKIPPSFTSSDDDMFENTLCSDQGEKLPWRLDDDLFPSPRKSSFKLNFIRSAHDIETEKNSGSNLNKTVTSSDSDSELEGKNLEKQEYNHRKQTNKLGSVRRNKLQIYSRANIKNKEKKLDQLKCTDEEERPPSSQSVISDILPLGSTYKNYQENQEEQKILQEDDKLPTTLVNETPSLLLDNNIEGNKCLNNQPIEENLSQQELNTSVEFTKDKCQSPEKATSLVNEAPALLLDNNIEGNKCLDIQPIEENLSQQGLNTSVEFTKDKCQSPEKATSLVNEAPSLLLDNNIEGNKCLDIQPIEENLSQQGLNTSVEFTKDKCQSPEKATKLVNEAPSLLLDNNIEGNKCLDIQPIEENLSQQGLNTSVEFTKDKCQSPEKATKLVNEAPPLVLDNNIEGNKCLDIQPIEENLSQQGLNTSVEFTKDKCQSPEKATSKNDMLSLIVLVENDAHLIINKSKSDQNSSSCTPKSKIKSTKSTDKSTNNHKTRSKSTKQCNDKQRKLNETEILATPLEDSEVPQLQLSDTSDKPESTENLADNFKEISSSVNNSKISGSGTSTPAKQVKKSNFKVPKTQVRKSRKKTIPESDDGVSSTIDSTQSTGVRRSGRERKPVCRRFSGVLATSSKREINYYNGTLGISIDVTSSDVTGNKSSRQSTKKKSPAKKKQKESKNQELVKAKGGKRRANNKISEKVEDNLVAVEKEKMRNTDEADIIIQVPNNGDKSKTNKAKKRHITDDISSTTDNTSNKEMHLTPKRNKLANENNSHSPTINLKKNKSPLRNKTSKRDTVSSTSHSVSPDICQSNLKLCVDNHQFFDKNITNDNNTNTNNYACDNGSGTSQDNMNNVSNTNNYACDNGSGTSQDNMNNVSTELAIGHNDYDTFSTFDTNISRENNHTTEENTQSDKFPDKDSGRSTMLRNTTSEDSNFQTSKLLTGRISKKYRKKNYIRKKISKVLSRSVNRSGEMEILNENEPNMIDSVSMAQTSVTKPEDSEYINVLSNNDVISMKYVEKKPNFRVIKNLMVTDLLKNYKDGGAMGYLKLPPGTQKPLHIAKKFALFYSVIEGEAFIQVHNKTTRVGKLGDFIIPVGTEYSINNISKEDSLTLHFVKVPCTVESQ